MLDTVGNNIANVNTFGFKGSTVAFKTLLSQTYQGAGGPSANLGGTNNIQVGLGMTLDSIRQNFTQGALQSTGTQTDLAISGDGFFRTTNNPAGLGGASGVNTAPIEYTRAGNFTFDSTGALVTSDGNYVVGFMDDVANAAIGDPFDFDPTNQGVIRLPLSNPGGVSYSDVSIGADGKVSGIYNDNTNPLNVLNGTIQTVAIISMAKFVNPSGLTQVGNNRWQASNNSGLEAIDVPGSNTTGMGTLAVGYLEMSNVDLATEFTEMIKAQRGFQANSRVITTSDEILQELVNLKR
jgi:flagellar hook protein FlgE